MISPYTGQEMDPSTHHIAVCGSCCRHHLLDRDCLGRPYKKHTKPGGSMCQPPPIEVKGGIGNGERDNAFASQGTADKSRANALRTMKLHTEEDLLDEIYKGAEEDVRGADSFFFFETLLDEAHPTSKLFYDKLIAAALLHAKKQRDYGKEGDPFANVRASEEWGVPGWVGAMIRATDKVRRLQTHATRGSLINESVEDSLLDLAVYSLISLVLYEQDLATKG